MTLRPRLLAVFVCFLLLSGCAGTRPPAVPERPDALAFPPLEFHLPEVERLVLPNGIRLYLKEDHELPLVAATFMVGAGSIGDPASQTGRGDLFAAALRTGGTPDRSPDEVEEALARLAADLSVGTDTYTTTLGLSLLRDDLAEGLAVVTDLIRRPAFDPQRLELARKQLLEGIRRRDDDPDSIAARTLMQALYGDHPLGRAPSVESVAAIGREDLLAFHRRFFHPNNLWIAVSGDFDRRELLGLIERLLGDWPQEAFAAQEVPPLATGPRPVVLVAPKEIPQTTVLLGEVGIDKSDPDLHPVRVMNFILGGGGFNSRLMREVRSNRGLAYSVYSVYQIGRRLPGPFIAGGETKSSTTLEMVSLMQGIMETLRREPVSQEELRLARESLINSFVFAFADSHDVVTRTMHLDFFDYPEGYLESYRDEVAAVTAEDVLRAARKHLHPDLQAVVLVGDREAFDGPPEELGRPVEEVGGTLAPGP